MYFKKKCFFFFFHFQTTNNSIFCYIELGTQLLLANTNVRKEKKKKKENMLSLLKRHTEVVQIKSGQGLFGSLTFIAIWCYRSLNGGREKQTNFTSRNLAYFFSRMLWFLPVHVGLSDPSFLFFVFFLT